MENQETIQSDKVIFGLSSKATLINTIILSALSKIFWAICYCSQIANKEAFLAMNTKPVDNVPWYYDLPLMVLSVWMLLSWIEFVFKIKPSEISWKAFRYKLLGLLFLSLWEEICKILATSLIIYYK